MKQIFLRLMPLLFSLPWKGLLLTLLFLFPSLALFGEAFSQKEGAPPSALLDSVSGPAPSDAPAVAPDRPGSAIKKVKKPPAKEKSPQALEEEAALRSRARWAADRYALSNRTLFDHILARHGYKTTVPGKSRFVKDFDVRAGIDFVLKSPDARIRANTEGRRGFIFEVTYHKKIGISPEKKPLKTLRVVIDEAGRVITAFPVK
ncbi:MAG: hypothetical protein LLH30_11175 [Candidatus Manganitrophus sp. SA1]|nr:hypothetical protein [Candidatus Manganitrophus morganii]